MIASLIRHRAPLVGPWTAPVTAAPGTARAAAVAPGTTRGMTQRAEEALGTALEDEWEADDLEAEIASAEIAAAALARATTTTRELPADWRMASDEAGRTYYYHRRERRSQASDSTCDCF